MSVRQEIRYTGFDGDWKMLINWDNTIETQFKYCEPRVYDLEDKHITNIEHDSEYVTITFQDKHFIQFKFEIDGCLVGDLYDEDSMFVDSIACWDFIND